MKSRFITSLLVGMLWCLLFSQPVFGANLEVPFKSQVPPGDWDNTMNCGQTSVLMVTGYQLHFNPTEQDIRDLDDWMVTIKMIDNHRGYNGNKDGINKDQIALIAKEYYGFRGVTTANQNDLGLLRQAIAANNPVIVGVQTDMVNKPHFMVLIGITDTEVVVNDPGHSEARGGLAKHYSLDLFRRSWATQTYASVIIDGRQGRSTIVGSTSDNTLNPIVLACYHRESSLGKMGQPFNDGAGVYLHTWEPYTGVLVQNFDGGSYGNCCIMMRQGASAAYAIRGSFWQMYRYNDGPRQFGVSISDQKANWLNDTGAFDLPRQTFDAIQEFERVVMIWDKDQSAGQGEVIIKPRGTFHVAGGINQPTPTATPIPSPTPSGPTCTLTIASYTHQSVGLSWTAVVGATRYQLILDSNPSSYFDTTTLTVGGFQPSTRHYFQIVAYDAKNKQLAVSNRATILTNVAPTPSPSPTVSLTPTQVPTPSPIPTIAPRPVELPMLVHAVYPGTITSDGWFADRGKPGNDAKGTTLGVGGSFAGTKYWTLLKLNPNACPVRKPGETIYLGLYSVTQPETPGVIDLSVLVKPWDASLIYKYAFATRVGKERQQFGQYKALKIGWNYIDITNVYDNLRDNHFTGLCLEPRDYGRQSSAVVYSSRYDDVRLRPCIAIRYPNQPTPTPVQFDRSTIGMLPTYDAEINTNWENPGCGVFNRYAEPFGQVTSRVQERNNARMLMRFDVPTSVSLVNRAWLQIWVDFVDESNPIEQTLMVSQVTTPWEPPVTWCWPWHQSGGDFSPTDQVSRVITPADKGRFLRLDVTDMLKHAQDGRLDVMLWFQPTQKDTDHLSMTIATADCPDVTKRPQLLLATNPNTVSQMNLATIVPTLTPSPTPTVSPTATVTPSPSPSLTTSPTQSPTSDPTLSPSPTISPYDFGVQNLVVNRQATNTLDFSFEVVNKGTMTVEKENILIHIRLSNSPVFEEARDNLYDIRAGWGTFRPGDTAILRQISSFSAPTTNYQYLAIILENSRGDSHPENDGIVAKLPGVPQR